MKYSYNKLWKMLIDKNMSKRELCRLAGVSESTIVRQYSSLFYQIVFTLYLGIMESLVTIIRFSANACEIISLSNGSP